MSLTDLLLKTAAPISVWLPTSSTTPSSPPTRPKWSLLSKVCGEQTFKVICHLQSFSFDQSSTFIHACPSDVVSEPDVAFVVLKEDSYNYSALVTCQSARGTTPITFSLYNSTDQQVIGNKTSTGREAMFKLPVVLGQHMGWIQCQASNGDRPAHSHWLPLEVGTSTGYNSFF